MFLGIMFYSLQQITLCKSYHNKLNPSHFNKDK